MFYKAAWLTPFLSGAATSAVFIYYWYRNVHDSTLGRLSIDPQPIDLATVTATTTTTTTDGTLSSLNTCALEEQATSSTSFNQVNQSQKSIIFDSPSLDQRILRKAEGALRKRTSRLILVIERCTNDHNYSAILRTAEALGIQHV